VSAQLCDVANLLRQLAIEVEKAEYSRSLAKQRREDRQASALRSPWTIATGQVLPRAWLKHSHSEEDLAIVHLTSEQGKPAARQPEAPESHVSASGDIQVAAAAENGLQAQVQRWCELCDEALKGWAPPVSS
jgi:hypothetical protein